MIQTCFNLNRTVEPSFVGVAIEHVSMDSIVPVLWGPNKRKILKDNWVANTSAAVCYSIIVISDKLQNYECGHSI